MKKRSLFVKQVDEDGQEQNVESIDPVCLLAPSWDWRFHRCPARTDYNVRYCRILRRATGFPEHCLVVTLSNKSVLTRIGAWINPTNPSNGDRTNEEKASAPKVI